MTDKGKKFEEKIAKELTKKFNFWNYEFYASPTQESKKQRKSGDVSLKWSTDADEVCILRDAHIEVSHRKNPSYLEKLEKAEDEAEGKLTIYFGKKTEHDTEFAMMTKKDLLKLLFELQGWREENKDKL